MTPQEKAKDLVSAMRNEIPCHCDDLKQAKQCALIAVDEILNQYKTPTVSHIVTAYKTAKDFNDNFIDIEKQLKNFTAHQVFYWQEVKQEIEKL